MLIKVKSILNFRLIFMNLILPLIWTFGLYLASSKMHFISNRNINLLSFSFLIIGINIANLSARVNSEKNYLNNYLLFSKKKQVYIEFQEILIVVMLNIVFICLFIFISNILFKNDIFYVLKYYILPSIFITTFYACIGYTFGKIVSEKIYLKISFIIYGIIAYLSTFPTFFIYLHIPNFIINIGKIFPINYWSKYVDYQHLNDLVIIIIMSIVMLICALIVNILVTLKWKK